MQCGQEGNRGLGEQLDPNVSGFVAFASHHQLHYTVNTCDDADEEEDDDDDDAQENKLHLT